MFANNEKSSYFQKSSLYIYVSMFVSKPLSIHPYTDTENNMHMHVYARKCECLPGVCIYVYVCIYIYVCVCPISHTHTHIYQGYATEVFCAGFITVN